jgi:hypothetical protein
LDFLSLIRKALAAAKFHQDRFLELAWSHEDDYLLALTAHLRAYFWELWSAWDYILQNANEQSLRIPQRDVNTALLANLSKRMPDYGFLPILESFILTPEFNRLRNIRHSAHRWVLSPFQASRKTFSDADTDITSVSIRIQDRTKQEEFDVDTSDLEFVSLFVEKLERQDFFRSQ